MQKYNFSSESTGTHLLLLGLIGDNSKVLDIGCASGYLGEYLVKEKGCEIWGIEPDAQSCDEAAGKGFKKIINKSVEDALSEIVNEKFDYILAGDIFEHLADPAEMLTQLGDYMDNGKLVLSLPNVAHYSVRFKLLSGNWDMADTGILDKTHLHFYTLKTARKLLEKCGWEIEAMRPRGDLERWFRKIGLEKIGKFLLFLWPEFFAVQFIFKLKKHD